MSVRVMTWVFESSRSKKNARLVLLAIADCANDEGRQAYPSMAKLRQKTGLGERAVTNLVADLEKLGELEVHRNGGPRGCNLYRVIMTPANDAPPQNMHPRTKRRSTPQITTVTPAESAPGTIREPSENHPSSSSAKPPKVTKPKGAPKVKPIRDDVERICAHLAARLVENGCKKPSITDKWRDAARLLMDKDGRTETQVIACIDWATSNEFWKPNIQSMPTLREKYDQLRMQADRERKAARASPGSDLARIGDYGTRPPMRSTTDERVNGWLALAAAAEARTQTGVEA